MLSAAANDPHSIQRYEGASTLYGPYTLAAYINRTLTYLPTLGASSAKTPPSHAGRPYPPDNSDRSLSFITGVVRDGTPVFRSFGDVKKDVEQKYSIGDVVRATFVGANPRNNLRLEGTYAAVERLVIDVGGIKKWDIVRDDQDWSLIFHWKRTSDVLATSEVEITWETEGDVEAGTYRFRYYGDSKSLGGTITSFEGVSGQFELH